MRPYDVTSTALALAKVVVLVIATAYTPRSHDMAQGMKTRKHVQQSLSSAPPSPHAPQQPRAAAPRIAHTRRINAAHAALFGKKEK